MNKFYDLFITYLVGPARYLLFFKKILVRKLGEHIFFESKSVDIFSKNGTRLFFSLYVFFSIMSSLPHEVLTLIFKYLEGEEILRCQLTCKQWHKASLANLYWHQYISSGQKSNSLSSHNFKFATLG